MTFKAYRASSFSHAHENHAFNRLHDILQKQWAEKDEPLFLLGNFYIDGKEIDALVLKRSAVIVIDFKDYGGELKFSENGRWEIDGNQVRGGSKTNPYQQIRDNKFQLLNYLKTQIEFESSPNLGHIAGLCLFHQNIEFDSTALSPNISRWFHVADMQSAIRTIDAIVSSEISFSDTDVDLMLAKLDVPAYYPDGQSIEVPIPNFTDKDHSSSILLNSEQTKAFVDIKDWVANTRTKVLALSGAFYTGKTNVLEAALVEFVRAGKTMVFLAPNSRIANRYKARGFSDVKSIYSWLYAGRPNDIKNSKAIYAIDRDPIDPENELIIIFDSHLLGNDLFETDTTVYGSGHILQDLIDSLRGTERQDGKASQSSIEFYDLPHILLMGDPYQLTRGARDNCLLGCQIFKQNNIDYMQTELNSQARDEIAPIEMLDFQNILVGQIKAQKFVQLPVCQQGSIKTITKGIHTDTIAKSLLQWPRRAVYLCPTNTSAISVNNGIRVKYLGASNLCMLVKDDIIDIHNRTRNLKVNEYDQKEFEWVSSGAIARVVMSDGEIQTKSITLKGRKKPVIVDFAKVNIEYSGGIAEILYLPDFLIAPRPELTQDQTIALQIWAREEADAALIDEKAVLDSMDKEEDDYAEALHLYKTKRNSLTMASRYTNVARIRYAYAMTVHRAQGYEPLPRVVLAGRSAHDTENPATDSYFRWLYTATTCSSDALQILDYPELTPLSKAQWSFGGVRLIPIAYKPRLYSQTDRIRTDKELAIPALCGFSNSEPRLLALMLTIYDLINDTDWRIETITQHNYKERYGFTNERGGVSVDLDYNGKYEVSIGTVLVENGPEELSFEIQGLLSNAPIYMDENIAAAVAILKNHLSRKKWSITSVDEKNYKAFLIAEHSVGKARLEINVPSDASISKKGVISSVKLQQADSEEVAEQFETDFSDG